MQQQTKELLAR